MVEYSLNNFTISKAKSLSIDSFNMFNEIKKEFDKINVANI